VQTTTANISMLSATHNNPNVPSTPEQPVIGVELDFEFDKSEQLCRAIEDAYEDVHSVLDIWKNEFQEHTELSDGIYFSDFLSKREEYVMDTNVPAGQPLDLEAFFEWFESKDSGSSFTTLQQISKADAALDGAVGNKVSVFHKVPDAEERGNTSHSLLASLIKTRPPVSLSVPSRHGTAPSRLLKRLNAANKTLAYDYDDIFHHFGDDWDHLHADPDMESHGEEADVTELREAHRRLLDAEERTEAEDNARRSIRDIATTLPDDGADDDYDDVGAEEDTRSSYDDRDRDDDDSVDDEDESFASSGKFHSSDDDDDSLRSRDDDER